MRSIFQYIKDHRVQIYNIFKWLTIPIVFGVLIYQLFFQNNIKRFKVIYVEEASVADTQGLEYGDFILQLDSLELNKRKQFDEYMSTKDVGDTIDVHWQRGKETTVSTFVLEKDHWIGIDVRKLDTWYVFSTSLSPKFILFLLLTVLLMPINLGFEAYKWKILVNKLHKFSFIESFKSLLAGISLSIFTPKRVGEFAGRIMLLRHNHKEAITSLFLGNMAQMIANLTLGLITMSFFLKKYAFEHQHVTTTMVVSLVVSLILTYAYFDLSRVMKRFRNVKFFQKHLNFIYVIDRYNFLIKLKLLGLSFLKYMIFIFQFVLLIKAFGIDIEMYWGIICASSVFFVKTMLPVPASVELALRGSIAMEFFGNFTDNDIGILVASILLWVINLAIPALLGSYVISKSKIK